MGAMRTADENPVRQRWALRYLGRWMWGSTSGGYLRPCVLADVYRLFGRTCSQTAQHHVTEDSTIQLFHKAIERQYFIIYGEKNFAACRVGMINSFMFLHNV